MPTAAKLIAGLLLAALAYAVSEMIKTLLPSGTDFGMFSYVNAVVGFLCGWRVIGTRVGRGWSAAVSNGFTGVVAMVVWCLAIHSFAVMVERSFEKRYKGAIEAIGAAFELMAEYAVLLTDPAVLGTLLLGALVAGYVAEVTDRHWS
ncbi:hypothetical protein ATO8_16248 [Roseivivax marinus]|jgi:hypothetical protein|uniref:Tellurium resistance protein n=1 Tax=Roseivivax marinus TaxID=1379903 RepID=W4HIJ3_9RHOB|nr:TrgA family protein [Roseivivax marinus]ETW11815.1 hypothetical protein ATO8_16248 [Roseivivax marinus]UMA65704.1 TrgA family protein [Roseivivax marinus]SEL19923.1 hypothetical protein SAMN05444413_106233 [Roseivivax marinus]